jgi:site-specific recombinase XerD
MTLKPIIRPTDKRFDGKVNIKLRITHSRRSLYLSTNLYIEERFFNNSTGKVKSSHPNASRLNTELMKVTLDAEERLIGVKDINSMNVSYLKSKLVSEPKSADVKNYIEETIRHFEKAGKTSSMESYETLKSYINNFHPDYLSFHDVNYKFLNEFQDYMAKKIKINSIAVMMRNLRAIFNKAINEDVIGLEYYPFRKFKIKTERPGKRSLQAPVIHKIATKELSGDLSFARDVFMLSFYLMGANLVDMFNFKRKDVIIDRLDYKRQKTGQPISMKIQPEALNIINRYRDKRLKSKYLLNWNTKYANNRNMTKRINRDLKKIAIYIGVQRDVTLYYARHSFATIAVTLGIPRDVIGKALSHSTGTVTDVYTTYDPEIIDNANRKIIDFVLYNIV